jgi:hypothetical protein
MRTPVEIRDQYLDSLAHIRTAYNKVCGEVGRGHLFTFPDVHKLSEGLFISALTYWEALCKDLILTDLANQSSAVLRSEVTKFRTSNAPFRLAERILNHPDFPSKYVEWSSFAVLASRADELLEAGHRFVLPQAIIEDLIRLKKIRNAIAHKSDKAWADFSRMIRQVPFNLSGVQCRGVTPGRFMYSHQWGGMSVMLYALERLDLAANTLVP